MKNYKELQAIKNNRFEPLSIQEIMQVSRAIKKDETLKEKHGIMLGEFALRVSLQLQEYKRLQEIAKRYHEITNKTQADTLREIADSLE